MIELAGVPRGALIDVVWPDDGGRIHQYELDVTMPRWLIEYRRALSARRSEGWRL